MNAKGQWLIPWYIAAYGIGLFVGLFNEHSYAIVIGAAGCLFIGFFAPDRSIP